RFGAVRPAGFHECVAHYPAGPARGERAAAPLQPHRPDAAEVDLRIAALRVGEGQLVDGKSELLEDRQRRADVAVVAAVHPEHAGLGVDGLAERLPQLVRALDHLDVDAIGPVDGADDARLAAGAGARIAGTPSVDEVDLGAQVAEVERRPAAESPGADDGD